MQRRIQDERSRARKLTAKLHKLEQTTADSFDRLENDIAQIDGRLEEHATQLDELLSRVGGAQEEARSVGERLDDVEVTVFENELTLAGVLPVVGTQRMEVPDGFERPQGLDDLRQKAEDSYSTCTSPTHDKCTLARAYYHLYSMRVDSRARVEADLRAAELSERTSNEAHARAHYESILRNPQASDDLRACAGSRTVQLSVELHDNCKDSKNRIEQVYDVSLPSCRELQNTAVDCE